MTRTQNQLPPHDKVLRAVVGEAEDALVAEGMAKRPAGTRTHFRPPPQEDERAMD